MIESGLLEQAVILVGGRGTRLGDLTRVMPKPLMPIAGRPFLDWLIDEVARFGIPRITLLAGYLGEQIVARYAGRKIGAVRIEVLTEPEPLGTAGGLRLFAGRLAPRFLMMNGDTRFDVNLLDLQLHARAAVATLALRHTAPGDRRYDTVKLAEDGIITGILACTPESEGPINGGIYLLDRAITDWIGEGAVSMESDVFPRLVEARLLRGVLYDGRFIDIGVPEDLVRGQTEIPAMSRRPAALLDRDGVLIEDTGHPHDPLKKVRWIPGAAAAVKRLNDAGYFVFVVTNQAGVARGIYPEAQVQVFHRWMAARLADAGAHIDAFAYCPHHPQAALAEYRVVCRCRKPAPGMIEDLCSTWPVDRAGSFLVGDKESDIAAAVATGLPGYLFTGGDLSSYLDALLATATREAEPA
jgi:histidinol-phosphate phosphatase family protein